MKVRVLLKTGGIMIFWLTVLSFVVALMTALIYPRPDRVQVHEVPLGEARVATFVTQHQAAREYANIIAPALFYMYSSQGQELTTDSSITNHYSSNDITDDKGTIKGDDTVQERVHVLKKDFDIGYMPEILPMKGQRSVSYRLFPDEEVYTVTYPAYDPADNKFKDISEERSFGYTSAIVCMNALDDDENDDGVWDTTTDTYGQIIPCQPQRNEDTGDVTVREPFKYVLTYGLLNPDTDEPEINIYKSTNDQWEYGLHKRTKNSPDCGWIDESGAPYDVRIKAMNGKRRRIPLAIYELYKSYIQRNRDSQPLFCITPVSTPYERNDLLYFFDTYLNAQGSVEGAPITPLHYTETDRWLNLLKFHEGEQHSLNTEEEKWNSQNDDSLKINSNKFMVLPLPEGDNAIENAFTLSMVLKLNDITGTNVTLFKTSEGGDYIFNGIINDGILKITVNQRGEDIYNQGTLEFNIEDQVNKIISLTYVFFGDSHALYIDDLEEPVDQKELKPDDTTFGIANLGLRQLHLFGNGETRSSNLNADVYAVRLYKTELTKASIRRNAISDKRRFRF